MRTISILWTVWNSYRIPTVLDGEPARARSQPHNMHIELRSEPEPDDPNQAGCITKKDRPSSKSMCGFKECSHASRKNIKIQVTGQRSPKPWVGDIKAVFKLNRDSKPYSFCTLDITSHVIVSVMTSLVLILKMANNQFQMLEECLPGARRGY